MWNRSGSSKKDSFDVHRVCLCCVFTRSAHENSNNLYDYEFPWNGLICEDCWSLIDLPELARSCKSICPPSQTQNEKDSFRYDAKDLHFLRPGTDMMSCKLLFLAGSKSIFCPSPIYQRNHATIPRVVVLYAPATQHPRTTSCLQAQDAWWCLVASVTGAGHNFWIRPDRKGTNPCRSWLWSPETNRFWLQQALWGRETDEKLQRPGDCVSRRMIHFVVKRVKSVVWVEFLRTKTHWQEGSLMRFEMCFPALGTY